MKKLECCDCGQLMNNDEIAFCLRQFGKACGRFLCLGCIAENFGGTADALNETIAVLKKSGCEYFNREYV